MTQILTVRKLVRRPIRLGNKTITSSGTQVDFDDPKVRRDYTSLRDSLVVVGARASITYADDIYNLVGDGTIDDYANLQTALAAGGVVELRPNKIYLVSASLTPAANTTLHMNGSWIKKKSTLTDYAVKVANAGVTICGGGGGVDGNRAGGSTQVSGNGGIRWSGASGRAYDVRVKNTSDNGWTIITNTLEAWNCEGLDNASSSTTGSGFFVDLSGKLLAYGCKANDNADRGVYFQNGAADGCEWAGSTSRNRVGVQVSSQNGKIHTASGDQNALYLVHGTSASGWTVGSIEATNTGRDGTAGSPGPLRYTGGTPFQLNGCSNWSVGTVIGKNQLGYTVALTSVVPTSAGSGATTNIQIGQVVGDYTLSDDLDPAVSFTGSTQHCTIGSIHAKGATYAVVFHEDGTPAYPDVANNYNQIGTILADSCTSGVVKFYGGAHNSIGRVIARDCLTGTLGGNNSAQGLINSTTADAYGNIVAYFEHKLSTTGTPPKYLVFADSSAQGNVVLDGVGRVVNAVSDAQGTNTANLRALQEIVVAKLDATETWSYQSGGNPPDDTTAGHFQIGAGANTGGKNVVPTGANVNMQANGPTVALNLTEMLAGHYFRVGIYIDPAVLADMPANGLTIRFGSGASPAGNYFSYQPNITSGTYQLTSGLQYLYLTKGLFTVGAGTPSWATITRISFFIRAGAGGTFHATLSALGAFFRPLPPAAQNATASGKATFSGNGATTAFTIPHTLGQVPKSVSVDPATTDAAGVRFVTADAGSLTVTYLVAPANGASNVSLWWRVEA